MNGNDSFSSIPKDVRDLLEEEGRRLEAIEGVIGASAFAVITYRVDYGNQPSFKTPPGVVKFSRKDHAIPDSAYIKLGSSRYYREYKADTAGVADSEEGRLVQMGTLSEFCKKNSIEPLLGSEHVSAEITWARNDFLMFCTSVMLEDRSFGELRSQFPDYDCATFIPDPSAFAMQLGKDIGKQFDMENVRLNGFDMIRQTKLSEAEITTQGRLLQKGLDTVVLVSHGPVTYCDPPERIINRFPIGRRAQAVPFVKRGEFAGQREYRFVFSIIGEPKETEFLMEVTDELRNLIHPFPKL